MAIFYFTQTVLIVYDLVDPHHEIYYIVFYTLWITQISYSYSFSFISNIMPSKIHCVQVLTKKKQK